MTKNLFKNEKVADQFNQYNDVLEQVLGYDSIVSIFNQYKPRKILDYGCGPGKVSLRLAEQLPCDIIAVDESQKMIDIARKERKHRHINYKIVKNDNLDFIKSGSIDGAIASYVFINNESEQRILAIMMEIYRVLKPKSRFLILDTNPNATGIPFSTFQNGIPGKKYNYGEKRVETLTVSENENLILHDFNWPNDMYENNLKHAGFSEISVSYPKLNDFTQDQIARIENKYHYNTWSNEKSVSPFILYQAIKK